MGDRLRYVSLRARGKVYGPLRYHPAALTAYRSLKQSDFFPVPAVLIKYKERKYFFARGLTRITEVPRCETLFLRVMEHKAAWKRGCIERQDAKSMGREAISGLCIKVGGEQLRS